jgi:hypothetical protein
MMGAMSQEAPPDVAHGDHDRPTPLTRLFRDRRVVPLLLVLGYVALAASVISEWQVVVVEDAYLREGNMEPVAVAVAGLGGWGPAYLCGLFLLVAAVTVTVFGPAHGRATGRLVTLAVGGTLLVVLGAILTDLGATSYAGTRLFFLGPEQTAPTLTLGRGVYCAAAGTLLLVLAAWLTRIGTRPPRPAPEPGPAELDAPLDLTVGPGDPIPGAGAPAGESRWHIGWNGEPDAGRLNSRD